MADKTDAKLVNPWGIAISATSPFWFADNGSGYSTLYSTAGSGSIPALAVSINPGTASAAITKPTGIVAHAGAGFEVSSGHPAQFIFDGEDGTITAWASATDGTHALVKVDNSAAGAVYKGLAFASNGTIPYLYAANFNSGKIDVFDSNFMPATLAGGFVDPMIPAGFAPFNIQALGGKLYVTYAKQDATKKFDVAGPGNGYVDVFDTSGKLLQQLVATGQLNSPWGVAIAPAGFGDFANDPLGGNFGNGLINVFNPTTGAYIANSLKDPSGNNVTIPGLWALQAGNGANGGDANAVYFTAGIPGPTGNIESHGLFGSLQAAPAITANAIVNGASFQPNIAPNTFITITGQNLASTTRTWGAADFVNGNPPTTLDGVSVTINGKAAYPYYISPTQINVLTPADTTQGPVMLTVTNNGIVSSMVSLQLQSAAPAFFLFKGGYIAATHADNSYIGATTLFPNLSTPAKPGETIVLYATGFGVPNTMALPTVMFGSTTAQVTYAGYTSPGLYQINVVVPATTASGDIPVVIQFGGQTSPTALLTVQQ